MGDKRLEVEGNSLADKVSGTDMDCALGAVCAEVDERESGNTRVTSARCRVVW